MSDFNVAEVWDALAKARPDDLAIVFRDRRLTRADVSRRANHFAAELARRGLGCFRERTDLQPWESGQDHLAIYLHNGNEYLEAMLAAFKARVAPFNVNYRYVAEELHYVLHDASATSIIFHSAFAATLADVLPGLPLLVNLFQVDDGSRASLLPGAVWYEDIAGATTAIAPLTGLSPDDLYILYTGGTTGMPKGVLWRQADAFTECFGGNRTAKSLAEVVAGATTKARAVLAPPFMHGAGHWVALSCWNGGGTVYIQDTPERLDPAEIWALVERERITFLLIVGDAFARPLLDALDDRPRDLSCLSVILSGGAALSAGLKEAFLRHVPQAMIIDGLGSSEVGGQLQHVSTDGSASTGVFPLANSAAILSEDLTRVLAAGVDELGWLAKRGSRLALGYLGDADKTNRTYPVIDGQRFGVPGDRARLTEDGMVMLFGRESATINSGGEKIFAEEVEAALKAHTSVYDCVVTSRPSQRWGNEVVAIVRLRDGQTPSESDLQHEAGRHIARFKLPKLYVFVDAITRSPAGKADYRWAKDVALGTLGDLG